MLFQQTILIPPVPLMSILRSASTTSYSTRTFCCINISLAQLLYCHTLTDPSPDHIFGFTTECSPYHVIEECFEDFGMCLNPCDMHMLYRAAIHNLSKPLTLGSGYSVERPVVPPIPAATTIARCSQFAVPKMTGKKNRVRASLIVQLENCCSRGRRTSPV
jgi:hypothetical protein